MIHQYGIIKYLAIYNSSLKFKSHFDWWSPPLEGHLRSCFAIDGEMRERARERQGERGVERGRERTRASESEGERKERDRKTERQT